MMLPSTGVGPLMAVVTTLLFSSMPLHVSAGSTSLLVLDPLMAMYTTQSLSVTSFFDNFDLNTSVFGGIDLGSGISGGTSISEGFPVPGLLAAIHVPSVVSSGPSGPGIDLDDRMASARTTPTTLPSTSTTSSLLPVLDVDALSNPSENGTPTVSATREHHSESDYLHEACLMSTPGSPPKIGEALDIISIAVSKIQQLFSMARKQIHDLGLELVLDICLRVGLALISFSASKRLARIHKWRPSQSQTQTLTTKGISSDCVIAHNAAADDERVLSLLPSSIDAKHLILRECLRDTEGSMSSDSTMTDALSETNDATSTYCSNQPCESVLKSPLDETLVQDRSLHDQSQATNNGKQVELSLQTAHAWADTAKEEDEVKQMLVSTEIRVQADSPNDTAPADLPAAEATQLQFANSAPVAVAVEVSAPGTSVEESQAKHATSMAEDKSVMTVTCTLEEKVVDSEAHSDSAPVAEKATSSRFVPEVKDMSIDSGRLCSGGPSVESVETSDAEEDHEPITSRSGVHDGKKDNGARKLPVKKGRKRRAKNLSPNLRKKLALGEITRKEAEAGRAYIQEFFIVSGVIRAMDDAVVPPNSKQRKRERERVERATREAEQGADESAGDEGELTHGRPGLMIERDAYTT